MTVDSPISIGDDRDGVRVTDLVLSGRSVVLTGPAGAGKSYALRSTERQLAACGAVSRRVTSAMPDSQVSGLIADLAGGVVIADDAETLPARVMALLEAGMGNGSIAVVFAVRTPDAATGRPAPRSAPLALWLQGAAERVDLQVMDDAEARDLASAFALHAGGALDDVTLTWAVAASGGSRLLLREIVADAATSRCRGLDPRARRPRGRVHDALADRASAWEPEDTLTLAVLHRLRSLEDAVAPRVLPRSLWERVVERGLVVQAGSVRRHLSVHSLLGSIASELAPAADVERVLSRAASRMLADGGVWWSEQVATALVGQWYDGEDGVPQPRDVEQSLRLRAVLDAMRAANDDAKPALARALMGFAGPSAATHPDIAVEAALAALALGHHADVRPALDIDIDAVQDASVQRWGFVHAQAATLTGHTPSMQADDVPAPRADESPERVLLAAWARLERLDWDGARTFAHAVAFNRAASPKARLGGISLLASVLAHLGEDVTQALQTLRRLLEYRPGVETGAAIDRLAAWYAQLVFNSSTGVSIGADQVSLIEAAHEAARGEPPVAAAMANVVLGLRALASGDVQAARVELRAASDRSNALPSHLWSPLLEQSIAIGLAAAGSADLAIDVLDRAVHASAPSSPFQEYCDLTARVQVMVALGNRDQALAAARAALAYSQGSGSPALLARDLYQLAVLGEPDDVLEKRLSRLADSLETPAARALAARISALSRQDGPAARSAARMLRALGVAWATADLQQWPARGDGYAIHDGDVNAALLTERELEIAQFIARGLTNKQVAQQLFLSVRTVESHVFQARRKLRAPSRKALGELVGDSAGAHGPVVER